MEDVQDTQDCVDGCDSDDGQCHNQCIKAHFDRHVSQTELVDTTFGEESNDGFPVPDNTPVQTPEPRASASNHPSSQPTGHANGDTFSGENAGMTMPLPAAGNGNSRSDHNSNGNNHRLNPAGNPVGGPASGLSNTHTSAVARGTIPSTLAGRIMNKGVASHSTPTSSAFVGNTQDA
ncbi:hypothetical protein K493DRAFT_350979 [Basidiobolus meristosporus CBS 931.73]|uniref:Uncharacterized protein n=1 Tax=Basidiobolus meristosporus CBS 931.73 TaxID=1314790 RepID=A0A1Y1YEQ8_9FUNG|nr:hypothetical protein K493DRAFT_350979 [Basidiobolus meristosporus CBS 931.73]|eukprot:ORX96186.1 hypothetical protein K493DRAFT_350979 [Basidiobolus meristosporus CBS 931.73]